MSEGVSPTIQKILDERYETISRQQKEIEELKAILDSTEDCRLLRRQENIIARQQAVMEKQMEALKSIHVQACFEIWTVQEARSYMSAIEEISDAALAEAEKLVGK